MPRLSAILLVVALLSVACSGGGAADDGLRSPVRGLLTDVQSDDGVDATAITLRAVDGRSWRFDVELDPDAYVDAPHLRLHIEQRLPVVVSFIGKGDSRVAHRIDDG